MKESKVAYNASESALNSNTSSPVLLASTKLLEAQS